MRTRAAHTLAALAAVAATACASGAAQAGPARQAQVHPGEESGLGIVGPETPEILKQIKADPYAAPAGPVCEAAPVELAQLDEVLGPDADQPQDEKGGSAGAAVGKAVRMLVPHRGIIRMVTGADKKEKELTDAAMAASARRGYLKGLMRQAHCGEPMEATTQAAAEPAPAAPDAGIAASATAPDRASAQLPAQASAQAPAQLPEQPAAPSDSAISLRVAGDPYAPPVNP